MKSRECCGVGSKPVFEIIKKLLPLNIIYVEKLIVSELVRNSPPFMKPTG
jgi:hypothetical protein